MILAVLCVVGLRPMAYGEHYDGKAGWTVTYTQEGKLSSNFHTSEYNDPMLGLQPGDDITFTVTLKSANSEKTEWYMTNEVLHSLEDRSKSGSTGGAYTYTLTYTGPTATRVLYDSDTVGGEGASSAGVGLHEATSALKDFFYLDSLEQGQTATVTLNVALDGESQGNRYQDTLADLRMNFAVETHDTIVKTRGVKTGDTTRLLPLFAAMLVSGGGLVALGVIDVRSRKKGS